MDNSRFTFTGPLEHINETGGWWYIRIPSEIHDSLRPFMSRGGLKINATIGKTTWQTAVMPLKKGVAMVAIKSEVRLAENLKLGQDVKVTITPAGL